MIEENKFTELQMILRDLIRYCIHSNLKYLLFSKFWRSYNCDFEGCGILSCQAATISTEGGSRKLLRNIDLYLPIYTAPNSNNVKEYHYIRT